MPVRFERSSAAADAGAIEQTRELLADFALLAKQTIQFIARSHRWAGVIVGRLRGSSATGKGAGTRSKNADPEIAAGTRKCAITSFPLRRFLATELQFICHFGSRVYKRTHRGVIGSVFELGKSSLAWRTGKITVEINFGFVVLGRIPITHCFQMLRGRARHDVNALHGDGPGIVQRWTVGR